VYFFKISDSTKKSKIKDVIVISASFLQLKASLTVAFVHFLLSTLANGSCVPAAEDTPAYLLWAVHEIGW